MSNLNVRKLDPPTNSRPQFDAKCGKIQYVSDSLAFGHYFCNNAPLGYSRKNPNRGVEDIFNFSFFYFTPGNSRQNKAQPVDILQNYVRSTAKNKDPWKFHIIFS